MEGKNEDETGRKNPPIGQRFSSTRQPKRNGRKPSQLKKYIKDNNLGIDDIRLIMKFMLAKTEDELKEIQFDKTRPMTVRIIIKAFLNDYKQSSMYNLDSMLNRIFGNTEQSINVNDISLLTHEEKEARLAELMNDGKTT